MNDLVGQLKVVEPLPELGELFVPSPLQLLFCFLVMPATCVANAAGLPLSDLKVFGVIQPPTAHRLIDDLVDYLSECLIHLASINSFSMLPHGNTMTRSSFSCRLFDSACRNGHDSARRDFRPYKGEKNLQYGKGQFAVEVVLSNPEPSPEILYRGKDILWCHGTGMNDDNRPVLRSDVPHGRMGPMPHDIVRRDIDLETKLGQHA